MLGCVFKDLMDVCVLEPSELRNAEKTGSKVMFKKARVPATEKGNRNQQWDKLNNSDDGLLYLESGTCTQSPSVTQAFA